MQEHAPPGPVESDHTPPTRYLTRFLSESKRHRPEKKVQQGLPGLTNHPRTAPCGYSARSRAESAAGPGGAPARIGVRGGHDLGVGRAAVGALAVQAGQPFVSLLCLRPGQVGSGPTIDPLQQLLQANPDLTSPFLVVAKRMGTTATIRIRQGTPRSPPTDCQSCSIAVRPSASTRRTHTRLL